MDTKAEEMPADQTIIGDAGQTSNLVVAMIVKNEAAVIGRCLSSVRPLTDKIVIIDTGSTDNTKEICRSYGATVYDFEWVDDFAAARNYSFDKAYEFYPDCEFVMWLDADDIIKPEDAAIFKDLVLLKDYDCFLANYVYSHDDVGNPTSIFKRERIVRQSRLPNWEGFVHEAINFNGMRVLTTEANVHQYRPPERISPAGRNLAIYENNIARIGGIDKLSARDTYYYAKTLENLDSVNEATELFAKFVAHPGAWWEDKAQAAYELALHSFGLKDDERAREWATKAIFIKHTMAEAYCLLGLINYNKSEWASAANWYEVALTCESQIDSTILGHRTPEHYTWLPHLQLTKCYAELGQLKRANQHNEMVIKYRPNDQTALNNRSALLGMLSANKPDGNRKRLNLGCGGKKMEGYVNCDLFASDAVDEVFSLDTIPYADGTIGALHSEHALEHLPRARAEMALSEWARVLMPGGELILKVPDIELCCRLFLESPEGPMREWYHHTIFGYQQSLRPGDEPDEAQFHHCGFTKDRLRSLLENAGFTIDYLENYDGWGTPSIACRAVRRQASKKVGWLTDHDWDNGPNRLRKLNIDRWMRAAGHSSAIISLNELNRAKIDICVYGGRYDNEYLDAVQKFKDAGGIAILDIHEDLFSMNWQNLTRAIEMASTIVCCSTELAKKATAWGEKFVNVIGDGIETIPDLNCQYLEKDRLTAVWMGYGGNAEVAEALRPVLERNGFDLITVHEHAGASVKWDRISWPNELIKHDIAIAPQRDHQNCKSNNKLTTYQALGLPTVCYPLPAYVEITKPGETAIIAKTEEEWDSAFKKLKDHEFRKRLGQAGRASVERFRSDGMLKKWTDLFGQFSVVEAVVPDGQPIVDIIIPTYNCPEYLEVCLTSIKEVTEEVRYSITVVDVGKLKNADHKALEERMLGGSCVKYNTIIPNERSNFSRSNNYGLTSTSAPYVCMLNDDTIVTPNWLRELKRGIDIDNYDIVGPFSNCDKGWLHNENIVVGGIDLHPAMSIEEVKPILGEQIYKYGRDRSDTPMMSFAQPWFAFYCVLMKRELVDKVGLLNEECVNTCEDVDYCKRAEKFGYRCLQKMTSFVFHFGGKARGASEKEDYERHHKEDDANYIRLNKRYGKKTVVIYTGQAYEAWSPQSITNGGIGGSETAVIQMAKELTAQNCHVVVFNDCREQAGTYDDIEYRPYSTFAQYADMNYFDLFISSRDIGIFELPIRAAKKICWVHDIWLSPTNALPSYEKKIDAFLCLSDWHKDFFSEHHSIDKNRIMITRNGIDLERFSVAAGSVRDEHRFIYSSSPDRGLDVLLDLWPKILEFDPLANLRVFYGFDNWNKSIETSQNKDQVVLRDKIMSGLNQKGIEVFGRVDQKTLANEMMAASIWAYPTYFWETFCITALEAQAAGLKVITSNLCGLKNSVESGDLISVPDYWQSWQTVRGDSYKNEFLAKIKNALSNKDVLNKARIDGIASSVKFDWASVAKSWVSAFF